MLVFIAFLSFLKSAVLLQFESYKVLATLKEQSKMIVKKNFMKYSQSSLSLD